MFPPQDDRVEMHMADTKKMLPNTTSKGQKGTIDMPRRGTPKDMYENVSNAALLCKENNQVPHQGSDQEPKQGSDQEPKQVSDQAPKQVSDQAPKQVSDQAPKQVSDQAPKQVSDQAPTKVTPLLQTNKNAPTPNAPRVGHHVTLFTARLKDAKIIVLHGKSGTGKTSLVHSADANLFELNPGSECSAIEHLTNAIFIGGGPKLVLLDDIDAFPTELLSKLNSFMAKHEKRLRYGKPIVLTCQQKFKLPAWARRAPVVQCKLTPNELHSILTINHSKEECLERRNYDTYCVTIDHFDQYLERVRVVAMVGPGISRFVRLVDRKMVQASAKTPMKPFVASYNVYSKEIREGLEAVRDSVLENTPKTVLLCDVESDLTEARVQSETARGMRVVLDFTRGAPVRAQRIPVLKCITTNWGPGVVLEPGMCVDRNGRPITPPEHDDCSICRRKTIAIKGCGGDASRAFALQRIKESVNSDIVGAPHAFIEHAMKRKTVPTDVGVEDMTMLMALNANKPLGNIEKSAIIASDMDVLWKSSRWGGDTLAGDIVLAMLELNLRQHNVPGNTWLTIEPSSAHLDRREHRASEREKPMGDAITWETIGRLPN
jgi:hypothetical protein